MPQSAEFCPNCGARAFQTLPDSTQTTAARTTAMTVTASDPTAAPSDGANDGRSGIGRATWYVVGGIVLAAIVFQFFLRYNYVHLRGGYVMRLDRLTASSCYMPCLPKPPTPTPVPYDRKAAVDRFLQTIEVQNQRAVNLAKGTTAARYIVAAHGEGYSWSAILGNRDAVSYYTALTPTLWDFGTPRANVEDPWASPRPTGAAWTPDPGIVGYRIRDPNTPGFETKLVSYRDSKGTGWSWEVHVDTGEVFYVNDNADLMRKYGFTLSKRSATP